MAPFATISRMVCAVAASSTGSCGRNRPSSNEGGFGWLHREPAIVPVVGVGVDLEAQLAHVKVERLVLVVHIETDNSDTFVHLETSVSSVSVLSPASRRRFSETAILRSGL